MRFDFLDFNHDGILEEKEEWMALMILDELMAEEEKDDQTKEGDGCLSENDSSKMGF